MICNGGHSCSEHDRIIIKKIDFMCQKWVQRKIPKKNIRKIIFNSDSIELAIRMQRGVERAPNSIRREPRREGVTLIMKCAEVKKDETSIFKSLATCASIAPNEEFAECKFILMPPNPLRFRCKVNVL